MRKVLRRLVERRIVASRGNAKVILRGPTDLDPFPDAETVPASTQVEKRFMEWMLRGDLKPGTAINALELGRRFGVSTTGIREFLNRFARFRLIERRPNARWVFKGFTRNFALELFDIPEVFELRSAVAFCELPPEHAAWGKLKLILRQHEVLHRLVNDASRNRFVEDFYDIIAFIFHYHYQWNKTLEKQRDGVAIREHLDYIEALISRDAARVDAACKRHLRSARETLLASIATEEA